MLPKAIVPLVSTVQYRHGLDIKTHTPVELTLKVQPVKVQRLMQIKPQDVPRARAVGPTRPEADDVGVPPVDSLRGQPDSEDIDQYWLQYTEAAERKLLMLFDIKPDDSKHLGRGQEPLLEMRPAAQKKETLWRWDVAGGVGVQEAGRQSLGGTSMARSGIEEGRPG